jgi:hypothetical protein
MLHSAWHKRSQAGSLSPIRVLARRRAFATSKKGLADDPFLQW